MSDSIALQQPAARQLDFSALVEAEQAGLLRLARRLVFDPEEARDLVQASLADAYERRRQLRDAGAAGAWLRRILVRRAFGVLRRRRLFAALRDLLDLEPSALPAPDEVLGASRHARALAEGLRRLPAGQATAFTLRYLEGLGLDEVAEAMGIAKGTVRAHLGRALARLREQGLLEEVEA